MACVVLLEKAILYPKRRLLILALSLIWSMLLRLLFVHESTAPRPLHESFPYLFLGFLHHLLSKTARCFEALACLDEILVLLDRMTRLVDLGAGL